MSLQRLRVVHVEDDADDAALVKHSLRHLLTERKGDGNYDFQLKWVSSLRELSEVRPEEVDVALVDLNLNESVLLNTLDQVSEALPGVPIVVLTAVDLRNLAMECLDRGAQDFLAKSDMSPERLARALWMAHLRSHRGAEATRPDGRRPDGRGPDGHGPDGRGEDPLSVALRGLD